jgi:SPP1 family predicted phage head-tail adaptor
MNAGKMNTKMTVQKQTVTRTTMGSTAVSWGTRALIWGDIEPLLGSERWEAGRIVGTVPIRIRARFRSDLSTTDRILVGTEYYYITEVEDPDGRRREIVITAKRLQ